MIATRQQVGRDTTEKKQTVNPQSSITITSANQASSSQQVLPDVITVEPSIHEDEPSRSKSDDSFLAVAREIIEEDGVTGLWLGIHSSLVLTANPAITYGVFERIKSLVTLGDPTVKIGPWRAFIVGALSKTLATIVSYCEL